MAEYGRESLWRESAGMDAARARELAGRLEMRGKAEDEIEARAAYLALLGVGEGQRVLDAGCGSGVVTREIARLVGRTGCAVGVDPSAALLAVARELADDAGLGDRLEFREGSVLALPFPDGAFDAVVAATVLSHVPGGARAVQEMVRVAHPGGRVGVFDFDGDSFVVTHADRDLTRRIVAAATDAGAVDSWLGRRLPGLFARAGLTDIRVRGFLPLDRDPAGFYHKQAERNAETAAKVGAITESERQRWLDGLRAEQSAGGAVAGRLHFFVWGRKPA